VRVAAIATSADASDEKDQADDSLLSGFRSGPGDWLNQGGLKIVQWSRRRVISVSLFALWLEFNRHCTKGIRILAGRRVDPDLQYE
jgi:hypothetical protein